IDMKADFVFDLTNNFGSHRIKGSLKAFDLTTFNPVFEPLSAVSIRSGKVEKINFNLFLNDYVADGTLDFIYSDLKIDMLDKVGSKNKKFNKKLTGLLANTFVVKKSNPSGKREPRVGIIHFKRPQDKSMFYFWNKALITGVKSTLISSEESK
ncbi:MAG: hypothetical protein H0X62_06180, partial [Bacteroidetes bacterium]|nr:hypothetical protein [Bacteroidota bacterium]